MSDRHTLKHILYDSTNEVLREIKIIETKCRLMVVRGWAKGNEEL